MLPPKDKIVRGDKSKVGGSALSTDTGVRLITLRVAAGAWILQALLTRGLFIFSPVLPNLFA